MATAGYWVEQSHGAISELLHLGQNRPWPIQAIPSALWRFAEAESRNGKMQIAK
jgi:hypothetical protein